MKLIYGTVLLALIGDVLHRVSHAPWRCDETCRWYQIVPGQGDRRDHPA